MYRFTTGSTTSAFMQSGGGWSQCERGSEVVAGATTTATRITRCPALADEHRDASGSRAEAAGRVAAHLLVALAAAQLAADGQRVTRPRAAAKVHLGGPAAGAALDDLQPVAVEHEPRCLDVGLARVDADREDALVEAS